MCLYCTEFNKNCDDITDEECDDCCDSCMFCEVEYENEQQTEETS